MILLRHVLLQKARSLFLPTALHFVLLHVDELALKLCCLPFGPGMPVSSRCVICLFLVCMVQNCTSALSQPHKHFGSETYAYSTGVPMGISPSAQQAASCPLDTITDRDAARLKKAKTGNSWGLAHMPSYCSSNKSAECPLPDM